MALPLQKTLYIGPFIHLPSQNPQHPDLDICPNGMIGVNEQGKISFVLRNLKARRIPNGEGWEEAKVVRVEGGNRFFFPGFVDTHIHAPQYPNAGLFGKTTLLDWLETYTFPLESSFKDLDVAGRIYNRVVARTLSHGTTTACYYATNHVPATNLLADICLSRGQRAFVGRVCMDRLSPAGYRDASVEGMVGDSQACVEHVRRIDPGFEVVAPILTPRFAPSCSGEALAALAGLQRETGVRCQTHISENKGEIALVGKLFPESTSYADVYDRAGLLTDKMILAHAVHLSAEERALIKARGAKISHCPASNTALTSGTAKVRELLEEGLTVGLGTDVSGGYTPSILAEVREALFVSRFVAMTDGDRAKLSVEEALYLATRGGAKVVGLEERIGGFEVGMDWDAQMVGLAAVGDTVGLDQKDGLVDVFGPETWQEKVEKWVYTGDDRNTLAVWVKGRLVHCRDGFRP